MDIRPDVLAAIGNTPLIHLRRASELSGATILGKAEFMNPGGSVKDRAALFIVRDALDRGLIRPGGTIVEGTAGNTGIGLALVGAALGLRTMIVMPETQSREKKVAIRLAGAQLIEVPAVPYADPENYVKRSGRLAEDMAQGDPNGALWANQFDNLANREAHRATTAAEIWEQTGGRVDGFVAAVGTGGTLAGVAAGLRERRSDVTVAIADPMGSGLYAHYTTGRLASSGSSVTEGIGQGRITGNLEGLAVDRAYQVTDEEALPLMFEMARHEGLALGGSAAINVAAAIRLGRDLGPGTTVVTILCDAGQRYASKLYNPDFLHARNLPVPDWLEG